MKTYRVERHLILVQFAYVQASFEEEARRKAEDDPQLIEWRDSSANDPVVVEVRESMT